MSTTASPSTIDLSRRRVLSAAAGLAAGIAVTRGALAQDATPAPMAEAATFLFVQAGFTSGILDQATEGVQSWMLTLQGAPAQTAYFSDHPERIAGAMATEDFLTTLDFSADDPPNAALVVASDSGTDVIVLELTDPVYDAAAGTLTYITKILDADQLEQSGYGFATAPLGPADYPKEFGAASLFIDSLLGCSPWDPRC